MSKWYGQTLFFIVKFNSDPSRLEKCKTSSQYLYDANTTPKPDGNLMMVFFVNGKVFRIWNKDDSYCQNWWWISEQKTPEIWR